MSRDANQEMEEPVDTRAAAAAAAASSAPHHATPDRSRDGGLLVRQQQRSCDKNSNRSLRKISDHSASTTRRTPTTSSSRSPFGVGPDGEVINMSLGDSIVSLDLDFLEDAVPPPELTRPEPMYRNHPPNPTAAASGPSPWNRSDGAELSPSSRRRNRPPALQSIMREQQQQQQQQQQPSSDDALLLHTSTADDAVFIEEINRVIVDERDEAAVEEAMIKLALERSLRSLHAERGGGGGTNSMGTGSYHNSSSARSLAASDHLVREVQMEADRTEQELVVNDSFHTPGSRSSRPSLGRLHSSSRRMNDDCSDNNPGSFRNPRPASRSSSGSRRSSASSSSMSPPGHGGGSSRELVDVATPRSTGSTSPGAHQAVLATTARSGSTPRRGVRRTQSSEGSLMAGASGHQPLRLSAHGSSPGGAAAAGTTTPSGRSAHRSGSGSSAGSGGGGGGGGGGPRVYPRQGSIRIGPLPKSALVEAGTLVDGAEAVLEVARQNLSANEVELIERALRKGKPLSVVESDGSAPSKRPGRRHHNHNPPRTSTPVSPGNAPAVVVLGDSRHSTSEASASFTSDELEGAASSHPMEIASEHTTVSAKVSPGGRGAITEEYDLRGAEENLSEEELRQIQQALDEVTAPAVAVPDEEHISQADATAIEQAIREAEEEEEMRNFRLALQMQQEEDERLRQEAQRNRLNQGNVRIMTRAEVAAESRVGAFQAVGPPIEHHPLDHQPDSSPGGHVAAGFRMNANAHHHEWTRRDQNTVIGPNQEVRTKHDTTLDGQANAHRLGLDEDENGTLSHVGNTAYNSFLQSVQRRNNRKGVSAHGTGRAGGSDAEATRGGAMDANVRLQISRAINNGYIDRCNGVVKEGKEAVVYHADRGEESGGFDVAIKVFKRIQDFKGRGDYVDGDPRYAHENFRRISAREQLELWTEKEFRNLTRATRAGVPVPTPLFHKENILFMRFIGADGWPAPQLREIDIRHGSKKWDVLYSQVMDAVRKLYRLGRLVHADLSEYNILVAPAFMVENAATSAAASSPLSAAPAEASDALQVVLIDFGQSVDTRHPDAVILLQQDLDRVKTFFSKRGVETMGAVEALAFVVDGED